MKRVVIYTQRVEVVERYQERRDCTDQRVPLFLEACGYVPVPLPNVITDLAAFAEAVDPAGIVLTGGNSLVKYGGTAPERDAADYKLIEFALQRGIPIYGFCRGMQSVLDFFGCEMENVQGHVAVRHAVNGEWGRMEVNSYHNQACKEIKLPLRAMATAEEGVVEAAACTERNIIITMWHPERENPFRETDINLVKKLFG